MKRLNLQLKRVQKKKTRKPDPKAPWSRAQILYIIQIMVCFGLIDTKTSFIVPVEKDLTKIPCVISILIKKADGMRRTGNFLLEAS